MSAFICSPLHISTLARAVLPGKPEHAAVVLATQNVKSVAYRYSHHYEKGEDDYNAATQEFMGCNFAEYVGKCILTLPSTKYVTAAQLAKLADCYDYQACETPDYKKTKAAKLMKRLTKGVLRDTSTPWGI